MNLATHNYAITLHNPATGNHRTFRVKTALKGALEGKRIAMMLVGPENTKDYNGFAFVDDNGTVSVWKRYRGTVYETYANMLSDQSKWEAKGVEYMIENKCRRCNRPLTVPESIASGIGPECATKI